ncbi:MAG: ribonuclease HII [Candidatus Hermodarchaeota archaeon]
MVSSKNPGNDNLIICGIDEAGRGPVFGPMIICGLCFYKNQLGFLKKIGVKDSKKLTSKKRKELSVIIRQNAFKVKLAEVSVKEIDQREKKNLTLNQIEEFYMSKLINDLKPDIIYIDAADVNEQRFAKSIKKLLDYTPNKIIAEHKADDIYPIVSASSIIAKVERDLFIEQLKRKFGDFGSGYPSDMKSIEFLRNWILSNNQIPPFARRSWQTTRKILDTELKNRKITEFTRL